MRATAGIRAMDIDARTCTIGTQTYHFDNELLAAVMNVFRFSQIVPFETDGGELVALGNSRAPQQQELFE